MTVWLRRWPQGEEDKEAEKRFLFIKVEVTGGRLISSWRGGWEVGSSEGWSKGITARREKSWPDSGDKMGNRWVEATHGCHFHPAWGNLEGWTEVRRPRL